MLTIKVALMIFVSGMACMYTLLVLAGKVEI